MKRSLAVLALVAVLPAPSARSEDGALVPARVRLTSVGASGVTRTAQGTLVRLGPGSLGVVGEKFGGMVIVPDAAVVRVETSRGPQPHTRTGLIFGAVLGAAVGLAMSPDADANCAWVGYARCGTGDKVVVAASTAVSLGALGALIGHFVRTEKWSDSSLEHLKLAVRPDRGGGRVAIAVSF